MRVRDARTGKMKDQWHGGFATQADAKRARNDARSANDKGTAVAATRISVREYLGGLGRSVGDAGAADDCGGLPPARQSTPRAAHRPSPTAAADAVDDRPAVRGAPAGRVVAPKTKPGGRQEAAEGDAAHRQYRAPHRRHAAQSAQRRRRKEPSRTTRRTPPNCPRWSGTWTVPVTCRCGLATNLRPSSATSPATASSRCGVSCVDPGMRRGEVAGLTWRDVDLEGRHDQRAARARHGRHQCRRSGVQAEDGEGPSQGGPDEDTIAALTAWRQRQQADRARMARRVAGPRPGVHLGGRNGAAPRLARPVVPRAREEGQAAAGYACTTCATRAPP